MMLGMSQEKVGDALGVTFQQLQKNERGDNRIGASRLQQLSNILQVPVSFFFEGAPGAAAIGKPTAPDITTTFFSLSHARDLAEHFVAIENITERRILVDVAKAIADGHRLASNARKRA
jgi:transcriptional regulator with XRE-family HTH domain